MTKAPRGLRIAFLLVVVCAAATVWLPGLLTSALASPDGAKTRAADAPKASSQTAGIASLPTAAQSAISAAIGLDQSDYQAQPTINGGFEMVNSEGRLNVEFAQSGVAVRVGDPNGAGWNLALEGYGRGKSMNLVSPAAPQANANRVEYHHGGLTEWYVNGPLGFEQGFTLTRPPVLAEGHADQPLTIALALSGGLTASLDSAGTGLTLKQQDGQAVLRYTGLSAQGAAGEPLKCWLELHGSQLLLRINDASATYPIIVDPWVQSAKLTTSDGAAGDELGFSVAIDEGGDTVVVGAYGFSSGLGNAYVFVRPTNGWAPTSTFTSRLIVPNGYSNSAFGDEVGWSVAISEDGSTVVAGAPQTEIGSNSSQGTAWVFVEPTGGWVYENVLPTAQLIASNGKATDQFGWSVGISGNTIVVGAPDVTVGYEYQGAAYVFVEPTGGWASEPLSTGTTTTKGTQTAELTASDAWVLNYFGVSVGISGNTVVVGAHGATFGSNYSQGAAYVFVEPTNGWASEPTTTPFGTQTAELTASDGAGGAYFGHSVGIGGTTANTVVVGAPDATFGSNYSQGAAYVFVEPTAAGGWALEPTTPPFGSQTAELTASNGTSSNSFGNSVAINESGDTVVAGAQGVGPGSNQGAAYVFVEPTAAGGWASATSEKETAELTASDGVAGNFFGLAVGISGNTPVVGASGANSNQGAAYVFSQTGPFAQYSPTQVSFGNVGDNVPTTQTVTVTNTGSQPLIIQLVTPSADGTIFTVTQSSCNGNVSSPPVYPVTISPAGSCVFTVQFDPTAPGAVNVQLGFEDNAGVGQSNVFSTQSGSNFLQSMSLSGTGDEPPMATYSPTTLSFGNVSVNTSVTQTVKLTNNGAGPLVIQLVGWVGGVAAGFSNTQIDCDYLSGPVTSLPPGSTLIPGSSCIFTVQFDPPAAGSFSGGFVIENNAGPGQSNLPSTAVGNSSSVFAQVVSVSGGTFITTTTIASTSSSFFGYALPAGYALVGNPITVNFTVQPVSGSLIPTGPVSVMDGFAESCNPQATLTSTNAGKGSCPLTVNQVGTGSTSLSATYTPDTASSSAGLLGSATVAPLFTENLVQIVGCGTPPAAQLAPPGTTTVFTFTGCVAGDVAGTVSAVCSNLPPKASCNPAPVVTAVGNGVYTVSVSVVTASGSNSAPPQDHRPWREPWPLTLFGIGMLLTMLMARHLGGMGRHRMRPRLLYAAGFAIALALLLGNINGCSSSSSGSTGSTGTPLDSYTIDVTIKAGTYSVIVPLSLTVTK